MLCIHDNISEIERLMRRDPGRRGLISSESSCAPLCVGQLAAAAEHLAEHATHVGIVTGFFVPDGDTPAAETDGPLGALMLARTLEALGVATVILTDAACRSALEAACDADNYPLDQLLVCPSDSTNWRNQFLTHGFGQHLTHLIAVERVGPSHTEDSLRQQTRQTRPPLDAFRRCVPAVEQDRCHNMHGRVIDEYTADLYRLFEELPRFRPDAKTIGIGDGGNEIGMGAIPWEDLVQRLDCPWAGRIPCRIATDWTLIAGTSNWGAYALAASVLLLRNQVHLVTHWTGRQQQAQLEQLVCEGPAVDGVTGRQEPTVDGLPFTTYIQVWEGIRRVLDVRFVNSG